MCKKAFVFLTAMPRGQGRHGGHLRNFSNLQSLLDLGYDVEVIHFSEDGEDIEVIIDPTPDDIVFAKVKWTRIKVPVVGSAPVLSRLAFRFGVPLLSSVSYVFPLIYRVRSEALQRFGQFPEAIFWFDGESVANAIPWLPSKMLTVWSVHDLLSDLSSATTRISCDVENREPNYSERCDLRFMKRLERLMAAKSRLVFCIGIQDKRRMQNEWMCNKAEYLPMSIPGDGEGVRPNASDPNGPLRIMHLGAIHHLPSFRSLEFLFTEIFPKMDSSLLDFLSFTIIGNINGTERANKILELARPYKNVSFTGFVKDIMPYYDNNDLQIVASTGASGMRTRIIESFAFSVPVLSTTIAAEGTEGLTPNKNILIADTPEEFIEHFKDIKKNPAKLAQIAANGHAFYEKHQSRRAVTAVLSDHIGRHI